MTTRWTTHGVDLLPGSVRKRFRTDQHGAPPGDPDCAPEREWRALALLDRYAPGWRPGRWPARTARSPCRGCRAARCAAPC
ncbi:hypothetical protein [Kitasatospora fiedleri]|uniref:hypothetical protein n=1 Tax=Kitasatospora fiedleri TaxID=2991545 RepID=UPI00249B63F0|nr:hypothetical protein [Kitasatospora fiedleri]